MTDDVAVSTEIQVDDETRAALLLFNERVEANAALERAAKRVKKAERAKDEAAAVVRKMNDNPNATPEQKAEAEEAYKAAVENYQVIRANPDAGQSKSEPKKDDDTEAPSEAATEESSDSQTDDAPTDELAETSADEEPAPTPAASEESE